MCCFSIVHLKIVVNAKMFFGNTFLKLQYRVLLCNCFFTNFHFHAKFEGTVSALAAAKTEFDDPFTTPIAKKKSDEVIK